VANAEGDVVAWVEANLGGTVTSIHRQARWRPAWFVDVEGSDGVRSLYVRGAREHANPIFSLEHEAAVMRVLEAEGVPVPHVHGMCPQPFSIVMDCAPGQADLSTAATEAEMDSVLDHYIDLLVEMHAIDPDAFADTGLTRPTSPEQIALGLFDRFEAIYRAVKARPDPLVVFGIAWGRRNVPHHRDLVTFVSGDSGQFLFADGRVTAILDLELAYLGDPYHDLANLRMRDMSEPLGDLARAFRRYEASSGAALDTRAVEFHTVQFGLGTPMGLSALLAQPPATPDLLMSFEWYHQVALMALEAIGFQLGVRFDDVELPDERPLRHADVGMALAGTVRGLRADADHDAYEREQTARLADFTHRLMVHGPAVDRLDMDEASELLGRRFDAVEEADAALEELVAADDGTLDVQLVELFHRRCMRQLRILEPLLRRAKGGIHHLVPVDELLAGHSGLPAG
jgi:aminoglycoside phosphotransferase (APT) family kinase protein